ncbi:MAG: tetratricopeptide repeat protein [Zoogloeaceae bacterium]|jgi:tetratricopeptide (TPR) repeat protein|nr:tetratricopeptide repeat protein [Zoogloeaceae bacterium]
MNKTIFENAFNFRAITSGVWRACLVAALATGAALATPPIPLPIPPGKPVDHEQQIADFTRAIEQKPIDQRAYFFRGFHYLEVARCLRGISPCIKGKMTDKNVAYQKAIADFTKAIELGSGIDAARIYDNLAPNDSPPEVLQRVYMGDSYHLRGTIYAELKAYQKAIADFNAASKTENRQAASNAFYALGNIYRDLGKDRKAIESYGAAIERGGNFPSPVVFVERGKLHAKHGEREKALDDAHAACEWTPPTNDCELLERLRGKDETR